MANLTFDDTHNMVMYLSKSNASAGFDQIVDFLNAQVIRYTLMVNPTIYVSCIKQFWASVSIKKVNDVIKLRALIDKKRVVVTEDIIRQDLRLDDADGVECLSIEEIFVELARMGYEKPPPKLTFYKDFFSVQWKFLIQALVQCMSAKRTSWNEFSSSMASAVICLAKGRKFNFSKYIFDSMVDDLSSHTAKYTSPTLTQKVFANIRRIGKGLSGIETPLFATMLVQPQAAAEEEDEEDEMPAAPKPPSPTHEPTPPSQEPIISLPQVQFVTPPSSPLQAQPAQPSSPPQQQPTTTFTTDMTLLNTLLETCTTLSYKGRLEEKDEVNVAAKEVNAADPTVFDDEEVTMTMAQTLIKIKAEKARLLDEQMAKRLHNEKVKLAVAKERKEQDDFKRAQELQQQYDQKQENINWNVVAEQMQEKHLDNIRKYQSLKRKPISLAQARKNMIVYLKNMTGYKITHFKGMTYDQESFKKLKAEVEVLGSHSTQDTPTNDPKEMSEEDVKNMLQIVPVSEHDIFMFLKKDYPLIDVVLLLMLSVKLQVDEDYEMARDLVMKIFIEANKPKSRKKVPVTTVPGGDQAAPVAVEPPTVQKIRKRGREGIDANAPPKSSQGVAVAGDPGSENVSSPTEVGSPGSVYRPEWGVTNDSLLDTPEACQDLVDHAAPPGYFSELRHMHNEDFLGQYNINLARKVAMGSQLRLRFEQEAKLLRKSIAQVASREQII
nr:hypothetical protein [Tanacetum cinerariifolium]